MNVRIVPRRQPQRTDLYGGVRNLTCNGETLWLWSEPRLLMIDAGFGSPVACDTPFPTHDLLPLVSWLLRDVAEILLDNEPGGPATSW